MAVIRVEKNKNYTVMSNAHLDDPRLSLRAIGLLSKMLRMPDDWDYTVRGLAAMCKEGRDAVSSTLTELIEAGYVVRRRTRDASGVLRGIEYVVYETAQPRPENQDVDEEREPRPEKPDTAEPDTASPPQPSTIENQVYIPPYIPPEGGKRGGLTLPKWKPEAFAALWALYPKERRKSGDKCRKWWDKHKPNDELIQQIREGVEAEKKTDLWKRGIGIPYLSTYLNGLRWEEADLTAEAPAEAPKARRYVRTDIVDGREVDIYE